MRDVLERLKSEGAADIPVVIGGIIPPEDAELLKGLGVAGVYTPRNFELNAIMSDIVGLVERGQSDCRPVSDRRPDCLGRGA